MKNWILATRPKTLTAAVIPVIVASSLVYGTQSIIDLKLSIFALLSAIFIQIGTNLVNDAMDFKKGADTAARIGPTRITASGMANPQRVLLLAGTCFFISVLFGIPLVFKGGMPIVIIGILSIACGYAYTSGPFPLAYRGFGDIFVILFFGLVAVGGLEFLLSGNYTFHGFILGLQLGLLSTVLIAINNYRDIVGDRLANKMTLAARFGEVFAKNEIRLLIICSYLLNLYWVQQGFVLVGLLPLLTLPLAFKILKFFSNSRPSPEFNKYLGLSSLLYMLVGLTFTMGFLTQ